MSKKHKKQKEKDKSSNLPKKFELGGLDEEQVFDDKKSDRNIFGEKRDS